MMSETGRGRSTTLDSLDGRFVGEIGTVDEFGSTPGLDDEIVAVACCRTGSDDCVTGWKSAILGEYAEFR